MQGVGLPPYPPKWANHYDKVRWARYVLLHGSLREQVGPRVVDACISLLRAETTDRRKHKGHPLRFVELWRPECRACSDPTWPEKDGRPTNPEGKPCGRTAPGEDSPKHGYAMEPLGQGRFRCPVCEIEEERTSQAEKVQAFLVSLAMFFVLLGSNRSSKSFTGSVCGSLTTLGAVHPDVVEFLKRNRLDKGRLQDAPAVVLAGSITNADSRDYLRPKYAALLPEGYAWQGRYALQDASAFPRGAGPGDVGSILFKSTSGADAEARWQGTSTPVIHNDEDHGKKAVLDEQVRAVSDVGGRVLVTATPTKGLSPMMTDILFREPPRPAGSVERHYLDAMDNPFIDQDAMARWFASMTDRQRRVRRFAEFVRVEGLVHPSFDQTVHVIPAKTEEEMEGWIRCDSMDFGFRAPFAYLWGAIDPRGTLHILRTRYVDKVTTDQHIYEVLRHESCTSCWPGPKHWPASEWFDRRDELRDKCKVCGGDGRRLPRPRFRVADPADADARKQWARLGCRTIKANKARRHGFEVLDGLLVVQDGSPGFVIHDHPSNAPLIKEIQEIAWKHDDNAKIAKSEKTETEVVGADHGWDAARYLAVECQSRGLLGTAHEHGT